MAGSNVEKKKCVCANYVAVWTNDGSKKTLLGLGRESVANHAQARTPGIPLYLLFYD